MKLAIIGAGSVGGTLGTAWAQKAGHEIFFGVRNPGDRASCIVSYRPTTPAPDPNAGPTPAPAPSSPTRQPIP